MMERMKKDEKTRTILSMILAPLIYLLAGRLVSFTAVLILYARSAAEGVSLNDRYLQVMDTVYQMNVPLTAAAILVTLPIVYFAFYEKEKTYRVRKLQLIWVIPLGAALCLSVNLLISYSGISRYSDGYEQLARTIYQGRILTELVCLALLPGILEELIYRGVMYKGFRKFFQPLWANLFSSLIFGAVHMNLVQFLYAGILGVIFAWVYERYQNIWAPILTHVSANAFSVLIMEWQPLQKALNHLLKSIMFLPVLLLVCAGLVYGIQKKVHPRRCGEYEDTGIHGRV